MNARPSAEKIDHWQNSVLRDASSDEPKHPINKENFWVRQAGCADCAIRQDDKVDEGDPEVALVVLQQVFSCAERVPFGEAGRLAERFFESDDLPQLAALDAPDVVTRVESLANLLGSYPQSWR